MPSLKLSSLSAAISIFQLASHLAPKAYAANPGRFTLEIEYQNLTREEAHSRFNERGYDWVMRSGIHVSLGTPRQNVWLTPLMYENETFIVDLSHCQREICEITSGGVFAANESSTWNVTRQVNLTETEASWTIWNSVGGNYTLGTEVGTFESASIDLPLNGLELGLLAESDNMDSINSLVPNMLGLGAGSTFLENLVERDIIDQRAFGFYNNTFDIGGIDEDRITGERYALPIVTDITEGAKLIIRVTDMELNGESIMGDHQPFDAEFSMAWQNSLIPQDIYDRFMNMTNGTKTFENQPSFPGWDDTSNTPASLNLTLTLSNGYKLVAGDTDIRSRPLYYANNGEVTSMNQSISRILSIDEFQPVERAAGIDAIFTMRFLNMTYLYVDYERGMFEFADGKVPEGQGGDGDVGDDRGSASIMKSSIYAWAVVMFSSAIIVMSGVF